MNEKYFRCDSCKRIFPNDMKLEIQYSYNTLDGRSKESLSTEEIHGMICVECGKQEAVNTSAKKSTTTTRKK